MSDQNVCMLTHQVLIDRRKDRCAVTARHPAAPDVSGPYPTNESGRAVVIGGIIRHPNLAAKNAAQTRNAYTADIGSPTVEILVGKLAAPQVVIHLVGFRIVIAGYPPHRSVLQRLLQNNLKGGAGACISPKMTNASG